MNWDYAKPFTQPRVPEALGLSLRNSDGATVLHGRWDLVCIDIAAGKPRRMPPEFLDAYMPAIVG